MHQFVTICVLLSTIPSAASTLETPIVETTDGPIVGFINQRKDGNVYHFYGIPYAEPPISKLRFMKPTRSKIRKGIYKATSIRPTCMQFTQYLRYVHTPMSEDCLFLNILVTERTFASSNEMKRPVMFWIHGGRYTYGSGSDFPYLSDTLVATQDIILVTINYRLDVFGFLYHDRIPEFIGNQGIWDQNMAMRWVKDNIAAFGDDPNSITIFGQSAGGLSTALHMASPYATGLFTRAIAQSFSPILYTIRPNLQTSLSTETVLNRSGCDKAKDKLECLQSISAEKLVLLSPNKIYAFSATYGGEYIPSTVDSIFLNDTYFNDVDFLFGRNLGDASPLMSGLLYQLFSTPKLTYDDALEMIAVMFKPEVVKQVAQWYVGDPGQKSSNQLQSGIKTLIDDVVFGADFEIGRRYTLRQRVGSTYAYILAHNPNKNIQPVCTLDREYGVYHQDDLIFIFGRPFENPNDYTDDDRKVSSYMMEIWADFARTGKVPWPAWRISGKNTVDMPVIHLTANDKLEINDTPARRAIDRFKFFTENLISKLSIRDRYSINKQIPIDRNSSREDYWKIHIPQVNNERL